MIDGNPLTDWASFNGGNTSSSIVFTFAAPTVLNTANLEDRVTSGGGNGGYVGGLSDFTTSFRLTYLGVGNTVFGF